MNKSGFSVGFSVSSDPVAAVEEAWAMGHSVQSVSRTDCIMIFSTSAHNPHRISELVKIRSGPDVKTMGGYGIGFFGHGFHAHGGFQLALIFICTDKFDIDLVKSQNIHLNQKESGKDLAKKISQISFSSAPDMLLFYDSINRKKGRYQINCCQYLIDGMNETLDRLPRNIAGAGFYGDILGKETYQWLNHQVYDQLAFACLFSGQINMRTSVISGSYPISPFLTVTRALENKVLEINGIPATDFIMSLILPGETTGSNDWRKYAFYVTLGVRTHDRLEAISDDNYLVRLCSGIDLKNKALIMFEPDLTEGTVFQLMKLEMNPESIRKKVELALQECKSENPVFALYIDCGARASAYCGMEPEEGLVVRDAIGAAIPFLGMYIGVESVKFDHVFRPLDWSGVLCLFSVDEQKPTLPKKRLLSEFDHKELLRNSKPIQINSKPPSSQSENDFYQNQLSGLAGVFIKQASEISKFRHRHHQYESALQLISSLQAIDSLKRSNKEHIKDVLTMINNRLHFEQSFLYIVSEKNQYLSETISVPQSESGSLHADVSEEFLRGPGIIATKSASSEAIEMIRATFKIRCFVAVPIRIFNSVEFILISGRDREIEPFVPSLNPVDLDIFRSLSGYLSSSIQTSHLYHSLDNLVIQRTEELEKSTRSVVSILKNISSGIFTVSDGGLVDPMYSDALHGLLETEVIAGCDPVKLLFDSVDLDSEKISLIRSCFAAVGSPILEWKLNQHHLPATAIFRGSSPHKTFKLNYDPVISKGLVEKILVSISDMTQMIRLKAESERKSLELRVLSEAMEAPPGALERFLTETKTMASDLFFTGTQSLKPSDTELISGLKRDLHTLKGNARSLKLHAISEAAHQSESEILFLSTPDSIKISKALNPLKETLQTYISVSQRIPSSTQDINAHPEFSQATRSLIAKNNELKKYFSSLDNPPARETLREILISEASRCIESNSPFGYEIEFHFTGDNMNLKNAEQALLRSVLGHLVRNSIAHSFPHQKKSTSLDIFVGSSLDNQTLSLIYRDSGKGLCAEDVIAQGTTLGIRVRSAISLTEKVEAVLFTTGFSTTKNADHLSGRGIGLDAIRHMVQKNNGTFRFKFFSNQPDPTNHEAICFHITLPIQAP